MVGFRLPAWLESHLKKEPQGMHNQKNVCATPFTISPTVAWGVTV